MLGLSSDINRFIYIGPFCLFVMEVTHNMSELDNTELAQIAIGALDVRGVTEEVARQELAARGTSVSQVLDN